MNRLFCALLLSFGISLLGGCGGMRLVDSQVSSFAPASLPPGSSYRFVRLPSQQADLPAQQQLESLAELALAKVGMRHDEQAGSYSVQVSAIQRAQQSYPPGPALGWNLGWMMGNGGLGLRGGALFPGLDTRTSYWREVGLIIRDDRSQRVVFESRASNDGPWADSGPVLAAMFDAALQGFPKPPAGLRRVDIEIPR